MFNFTKYSIIYYIFSSILVIAAVVSLFMFGLRFGIEFVGGSSMEVDFSAQGGSAAGGQRPANEAIQNALKSFDLGQIVIQPTG